MLMVHSIFTWWSNVFILAEQILKSLLTVFSLISLLSFGLAISIYYILKEEEMQIQQQKLWMVLWRSHRKSYKSQNAEL